MGKCQKRQRRCVDAIDQIVKIPTCPNLAKKCPRMNLSINSDIVTSNVMIVHVFFQRAAKLKS